MIRRIVIDHYKSIDHVDLSRGPLSILVGPNGIGKSNFVDAIRFVRDVATYGLDRAVADRHGIDSVRQWSPSKPYQVSLRIEVDSPRGSGYLAFTLASARGSHVVRREEGEWTTRSAGGEALSPHQYTRDTNGAVVVRHRGRKREIQAEAPEELFLPSFEAPPGLSSVLRSMEAYSIYPNVLRRPQRPSSDRRLTSDGDNLTSVFKNITSSKNNRFVQARNEIIASMQQVMPALENIRIQSLGGLMVPSFRVKERDGRVHDFNVAQVSDGTLRVLGLLTALYQPHRPDVLAMEEPEQTINPGVLSLLAESIMETSLKSQVILTTHSPELLDKFNDPQVVYSVEMDGGITKIAPINQGQLRAVRDRLFTLGELMSREGLHA